MFGGTGIHVLGSLAFAHMQHTSFSVNSWPPPPGCLPPPPMGLPGLPPRLSPRLNAAFWQPGDAPKP